MSELHCSVCGTIYLHFSWFRYNGQGPIIRNAKAWAAHWASEHEIRHAEGTLSGASAKVTVVSM